MHDMPDSLAAEMQQRAASQLDERFDDVCTFDSWRSIPIHVVAGRDDRFFPLELLQQRVARERLGVDPVVVSGGHLAALSHPDELAIVLAGLVGPA
jgi:pimeloyl-ACP methyl ester carboxylesterase